MRAELLRDPIRLKGPRRTLYLRDGRLRCFDGHQPLRGRQPIIGVWVGVTCGHMDPLAGQGGHADPFSSRPLRRMTCGLPGYYARGCNGRIFAVQATESELVYIATQTMRVREAVNWLGVELPDDFTPTDEVGQN